MKPITEALKAVTLPWLACSHVTLHGLLACSFGRCNCGKDEGDKGNEIPLLREAIGRKVSHGDDEN